MNCQRQRKVRHRGCCAACYQRLSKMIQRGETSWAVLEQAGKACQPMVMTGEFRARFARGVGLALVLLLSSCTSYERFIQTLEDRHVTSCIEANMNVGSLLAGGSAMGRIYTATGGAELNDCMAMLKYGHLPDPAGSLRGVMGGESGLSCIVDCGK